MDKKVILYSTATCPVCEMVRGFLTNMNVEYDEVFVDLNPLEMIKLIGRTRRFTVPQTHINGQWVNGFDPVRMLELLQEEE